MKNTSLWCALALTVGLSLLGQPSDVMAAGCEKDTDCKGDRICQDGNCVTPGGATTAPAAGCSTDQDCPGDQYCESGACVSPPAPAGTQPPPAGTQPPPAGTAPPGYGQQPPPGYGQQPPPGTGTPQYGYAAPGGAEGVPMVEYERRSAGLMVVGAILTPLGGLAVIGGAIGTAATAAEETCTYSYYSGTDCSSGDPHPAPIAVLIGGAVFLVVGIIFLAIGAPKVPVDQAGTAYIEPAPDGIRLRF